MQKSTDSRLHRRSFLTSAAALAGLSPRSGTQAADPRTRPPARIAITLDLEMSRNFPTWEQTHWDFQKGNLDEPTKRYALQAARRVKARGGRIHFFAVGRVLEQEDVSWLKSLASEGHPIGNHTYDHVNVKATRADQLQFRFQRAPWLIEGKTPAQVISENIAMTSRALAQRAGIRAAGFRTPGGFHDGLNDRPDVRRILLEQGFRWVSSLYPPHPIGATGQAPTAEVLSGIVAAQKLAQPFKYPDGLVEIPMSPISDVSAFRTGRWSLDSMKQAVQAGVSWAIEQGAVYDFLGHPSCLVATDPGFQIIDLILDLVEKAGSRARLVDLSQIASELM